MVASGIVAWVVAAFILIPLGMGAHDDYDYYGKYVLLIAAIGFWAPGILVCYLHNRGTKKGWSGRPPNE